MKTGWMGYCRKSSRPPRAWVACGIACVFEAGSVAFQLYGPGEGARPGDATQITPLFVLFNGGFGMYLGIFGAESFSESMKKKIARGFDIDVFDIYGMTESGGVGTLGMNCTAHDSLRVWENQYIIEIINPKTGEPVADGEEGELVFTSLTREALPMIRFRTADLTGTISRGGCDCGRTHLKIAPITGRRDDMLIAKGVNFFPKQIEQTLLGIPGIGNNFRNSESNEKGQKKATFVIEDMNKSTAEVFSRLQLGKYIPA